MARPSIIHIGAKTSTKGIWLQLIRIRLDETYDLPVQGQKAVDPCGCSE